MENIDLIGEIKNAFSEAVMEYYFGKCLIEDEKPFGKISVAFTKEEKSKLSKITIDCHEANESLSAYIIKGVEGDMGDGQFYLEFVDRGFASVFITRKLMEYTHGVFDEPLRITIGQATDAIIDEDEDESDEDKYGFRASIFRFVGLFGVFCKLGNENPVLYSVLYTHIINETWEQETFMQKVLEDLKMSYWLNFTHELEDIYLILISKNYISAEYFERAEKSFNDLMKENKVRAIDTDFTLDVLSLTFKS
jgi:hypothetical protein